MGRRNTSSTLTCRGSRAKSFNSNQNTALSRFGSSVAGSSGEVLSDQPIARCCIDPLNRQRLPDISNNVGPVKPFLGRLIHSLKRVFSSASWVVLLVGLDDFGSFVI